MGPGAAHRLHTHSATTGVGHPSRVHDITILITTLPIISVQATLLSIISELKCSGIILP